MKRYQLLILFCGLFGLVMQFLPGQAYAIHVSPETVKVSATYNGQDIAVTGEIKGDEEAVVQIIGDSSKVELKQKGKVGGLLWMTVGHISISNAPTAYLVCLPKSIDDLRKDNDPIWEKLNIGFSSLQGNMVFEPEPENRERLFTDFIDLKTHDNLYHIFGDVLQYDKDPEGDREFKAIIHIPAKMPVADYQVKVLRLKNGEVVGIEEANLKLEETGFPLLISKLAFNHSLLYGVLAVVIAVFAGLFMGVLFKDRGGSH